MLQRVGADEWAQHGVTTTFIAADDAANDANPRVTDGCGFGWRFTYNRTSQSACPTGKSSRRPVRTKEKIVLAIGFDPYLLVRDTIGIVDIIARSSRSATGSGSKTFNPSGGNGLYALDDRGQQLYVTSCPVCALVYNDTQSLKADKITITVSFQSPDIRMPVSPPMPPAAARFTQSVYDTILIGNELNDVEFILPSRKKLDRVIAYKAVYGNREVLRGISSYLDMLLFDDHFAEASLREFGEHKAPSASDVLEYESDSDIEEDFEEGSVEQGANDASLPDESRQEGQDDGHASPKVSDSPSGTATPFDIFGETEQPRREVNAERRKGRVLHIDGFAYHTWRALIFYLYTSKITFRELKSCDPSSPSHSDGCSPKSMYRVAHMLEMPDLQALCLKNLESQLTAENIVQEVFSVFTSRYMDVRKMEISTLKKYYKECAQERTAILARVVKGELPHCMDVVEAMMNFAK